MVAVAPSAAASPGHLDFCHRAVAKNQFGNTGVRLGSAGVTRADANKIERDRFLLSPFFIRDLYTFATASRSLE